MSWEIALICSLGHGSSDVSIKMEAFIVILPELYGTTSQHALGGRQAHARFSERVGSETLWHPLWLRNCLSNPCFLQYCLGSDRAVCHLVLVFLLKPISANGQRCAHTPSCVSEVSTHLGAAGWVLFSFTVRSLEVREFRSASDTIELEVWD